MKAKHFRVEEFVPESLYKVRGEKCWELIDDRLVKTADQLKEKFPEGSMTINNWVWDGNRMWSGLRTAESRWYSPTSQHSFGRAFDAVFSDYDEAEVRRYVIEHPEEFPYVRGVEDFAGMGWVHVDVRNTKHVKVFGKA